MVKDTDILTRLNVRRIPPCTLKPLIVGEWRFDHPNPLHLCAASFRGSNGLQPYPIFLPRWLRSSVAELLPRFGFVILGYVIGRQTFESEQIGRASCRERV